MHSYLSLCLILTATFPSLFIIPLSTCFLPTSCGAPAVFLLLLLPLSSPVSGVLFLVVVMFFYLFVIQQLFFICLLVFSCHLVVGIQFFQVPQFIKVLSSLSIILSSSCFFFHMKGLFSKLQLYPYLLTHFLWLFCDYYYYQMCCFDTCSYIYLTSQLSKPVIMHYVVFKLICQEFLIYSSMMFYFFFFFP